MCFEIYTDGWIKFGVLWDPYNRWSLIISNILRMLRDLMHEYIKGFDVLWDLYSGWFLTMDHILRLLWDLCEPMNEEVYSVLRSI